MTTSTSPTATIVMSPTGDASSLRAAALKTLKSGKRRRPVAGQQPHSTHISRYVPQDSFQLDYGQDDTSMDTQETNIQITSSNPSKPKSPTPLINQTEDVDMREEGEISDEESSPTVSTSHLTNGNSAQNIYPPVQSTSSNTNLATNVPALLGRLSLPQSRMPSTCASPTSPHSYTEAVRHPPVGLPSRPSTPTQYTVHASPREQSPIVHQCSERSSSPNAYFAPASPASLIATTDSGHVPAGTPITQTEYDVAKDNVLDLLGWGVPPEYLVDCGVNRELVYFIFMEFRLQLPPNLNTTGLTHYNYDIQPSTPQVDITEPGSRLTPHAGVHDRLREESNSVIVQDPSRSSISSTRTMSPPAMVSHTPEDLHDMERQRRQELLARKKAAVDSRKGKQRSPPVSGPANVSTPQPDDIVPPVPTEIVENFLKTIGPNVEGDRPSVLPGSTIEYPENDSGVTEIDEIPGLSGSHSLAVSVISDDSASTSAQTMNAHVQKTPPPTSGNSVTMSFGKIQLDSLPSNNGPSDRPVRTRTSRRPVASDFVDVDDHHLSTSNMEHHINRRRAHSSGMNFANISNMRRCVIDLSDSEDDMDYSDNNDSSKLTVPTPSSIFIGSATSAMSLRGSPAPAAKVARSATVTPSPETLALELKIRKMREAIAHREELRKRKLAKISVSHANETPSAQGESSESDVNIFSLRSDVANSTPGAPNHAQALTFGDETSGIHGSLDTPVEHEQGIQAQPTELATISRQEAMALDEKLSSLDVDAGLNLSLSAQAKTDNTEPQSLNLSYQTYQSTLSKYPLLRTQLTPPRLHISDPYSSDIPSSPRQKIFSQADNYSPMSIVALPDLGPLKLATTMKQIDTSKQLCRYEVPGGGVCRDEGCDDIHLSRLLSMVDGEELEPSDTDTAGFLLGFLPADWQARNDVSIGKMAAALALVRQSASLMTLSFEERVKRAIRVFERPPDSKMT